LPNGVSQTLRRKAGDIRYNEYLAQNSYIYGLTPVSRAKRVGRVLSHRRGHSLDFRQSSSIKNKGNHGGKNQLLALPDTKPDNGITV
jgi:hypothetical protein